MTKVEIFSSPAFDQIANILVTETATMANVSLYLWFAKYMDYDLPTWLKENHPLVLQLANSLKYRAGEPLIDIYRKVFTSWS